MEQDNPFSDLTRGFIDRTIDPVYRYHLVRSDDYLEAQAHTIQTLSRAMKGSGSHGLDQSRERIWVMGIARYQQAYGSKSFGKESRPQPGSDEEPADQAETIRREQIATLAHSLERLPLLQADALALHYFSGLALTEVGKVLGKNGSELQELILPGIYFAEELIGLARPIQAPEGLKSFLIDEAAQSHPAYEISAKADGATYWSGAFRRRTLLASSLKAGQAVLLAGALVLGLFVIERQSGAAPKESPKPVAMVTQTPTPVPTPQADTLLAISNSMVPPPKTTCQFWKSNLEYLIENNINEMDAQPFTDPTGENPGNSGTGCLLLATISGPNQNNAVKTVGDISQLFVDNGFGQGLGFDNLPGSPSSAFYPQDCPGFGRVYQGSDLYVFLSVSYCSDHVNQAGQSALDQTSVRGYTLRLFLASSAAQARLNTFFNLWASGDNQAIAYLAPDMGQHYRTVQALDRMAGISRRALSTVQFTWQPVLNSGSNLAINVKVESGAKGSPTPSVLTSFQVVLALENGVWAIENVANPAG